MRLFVNTAFAAVTAVLYGYSALVIFGHVTRTKAYLPADAETTLLGLTGGAVVAFLVAQLGLAVGNSETGAKDSLRAAVSGDKAKGSGEIVLGLVAAVFVVVGLLFVVMWTIPDVFAGEGSAKATTEAKDLVALQAKAFLGVAIAGFTAVASASTP